MFDFTAQERRVILFFLSMMIVGIAISYLKKSHAHSELLTNLYQNIGKINLNTADKASLVSIPGIADKLADRILEYRDKEGSFLDTEDLKQIKGITNYRYEKIKDYLFIK